MIQRRPAKAKAILSSFSNITGNRTKFKFMAMFSNEMEDKSSFMPSPSG